MMTPQTIDQRLAILSSLTVVSEFIFVIQMILPQSKSADLSVPVAALIVKA
jgi:hypothetical protein